MHRTRSHRTRIANRRRGMALLMAIGVLTLLAALAGMVVQASVAAHKESRLLERRAQAEACAVAARELALAKLAADPSYRGHTWRIPAQQAGLDDELAAEIKVTAPADAAASQRVEIIVTYGRDPLTRVRLESSFAWRPAPAAP